MAREYQHKKSSPQTLPHNLYFRVLYIIRDYDRLKDEYHAILHSSPAPRIESGYDREGRFSVEYMPRGNAITSPTEEKAIRLALISDELQIGRAHV